MKLGFDPRLPDPPADSLSRRLNSRWYDLWRDLAAAINERLTVQQNGDRKGAEPVLNFIAGTGISITVEHDPANGRINVTIATDPGT